jgi:hypothetical protein
MQSYDALMSDPTELVYRHHEQLYRLALLLAGNADGAAKLVERAYRQLPVDAPNAEAQLIRGLLRPAPRMRGGWRLDATRLGYTPLDRERATVLLGVLEAMPAPVRLVVGLHYLRGMAADESEQLLSPHPFFATPGRRADATPPLAPRGRGGWGEKGPASIGEALTHLRITVARALEAVDRAFE